MILLALWSLLFAAMLGFIRVIMGPTVADRLVAADALAVIIAMILVMLGLHLNAPYLLDVALVFAVLSFVDMLLMAKYFEHGELHK